MDNNQNNNKPVKPNPNNNNIRRAPIKPNFNNNINRKTPIENTENKEFVLNTNAMQQREKAEYDKLKYEESKRRYQQEQIQKEIDARNRDRIAREQYARQQQEIARRRKEMQRAEQERIRRQQQELAIRQEQERKRAEREEKLRQEKLEREAIDKHPFTRTGLVLGIGTTLTAICRILILFLMTASSTGVTREQIEKFGVPYCEIGAAIIGLVFSMAKTKITEPTTKNKIAMWFNCASIIAYSIITMVYFILLAKFK